MHPIAFKFGTVAIHWYGIMVALGFLVALWAASRRSVLDGFTPDQILDLGPWLIVGGIVGGRTLYVLTFWQEQFAGKPFWEVFMIQHGGLVFYGGFIGASLAVVFYALLKKLQIWKVLMRSRRASPWATRSEELAVCSMGAVTAGLAHCPGPLCFHLRSNVPGYQSIRPRFMNRSWDCACMRAWRGFIGERSSTGKSSPLT